jgi:hypothetical protein
MITLVPEPTDRRDKRGRRIGYNWWREWNVAELHAAENDWQAKRESGDPIHTDRVPGASYDTAYYQLSDAEFRMIHPRPTLKDFLVANAGMNGQYQAA